MPRIVLANALTFEVHVGEIVLSQWISSFGGLAVPRCRRVYAATTAQPLVIHVSEIGLGVHIVGLCPFWNQRNASE